MNMPTRFILAPYTVLDAAIEQSFAWAERLPIDVSILREAGRETAATAAAEYALNMVGLTAYESLDSKELWKLMDATFGKHSYVTRWCESGMCGCMGCVNFDARKNDITKEQWDAWLRTRKPKEWQKLEDSRLAWLASRKS